ncbi:hypothetical protein M3Y97_00947300 [Aphelenchoides bicaudatus]|nr:hypothetical protein M3Y97_00947300 [Aphelenchoides bicaudatus]
MDCVKKEGSFCELKFVDQRYSLELKDGFENKPCEVYLYDCLNAQKKKLDIEGEITTNDVGSDYFLFVLNSNYFIVHNKTGTDKTLDSSVIHLMELDIQNLECKVVESHEVYGLYVEWFKDVNDPACYVCFVIGGGAGRSMERVHFIDGHLEFDEQVLYFDHDVSTVHLMNCGIIPASKLEGNSICSLVYEQPKQDEQNEQYPSILIYNLELVDDWVKCSKLFKIPLQTHITRNELFNGQHLWINNICYCLHSNGEVLVISKFDLDNRTATKLDWSVSGCQEVALHHNDDVLIVCVLNNKTKLHKWHQIDLK